MDEKKTTKPSLQTQSAWLLFAKLLGFCFSFILPLVVVRLLDKENFGLYRQAFIVLTNAVGILPLGMAMSAFYYLSRDEEKRASAILNILLFNFVGGFLAFLALLLYPQILGSIFQSPKMTALAPAIGLAIWLWLFSMFLETVAVANQESKLATLFIVFSQFSKTALMVTAVCLLSNVESIVYAAIIQGIIQTIILLVYLNYRFPQFWLKFDLSFFREHLVYAIPFGLAGILWIAQTDIHYYFVGYKYGEEFLAIYVVGCFQLPLVSMLTESVNSVMIPRMSELQLVEDTGEMIRITARAMQKLAFFYFPAYVFLFITSEVFITTLFTKKYADSVPVFLVFLTLLPFSVLVSDPVVRAYPELGRFLLKLRFFTFMLLVATLYFGIQYVGLVGIIAIVIGVRIAERIYAEFVIFKKIGTKLSDLLLLKNVGKTAIASVLAGVVTWIVYYYLKGFMFDLNNHLSNTILANVKPTIVDFATGTIILGVCFAVFCSIYLPVTYFWKIIDANEKEKINNLLRKPFALIKRN